MFFVSVGVRATRFHRRLSRLKQSIFEQGYANKDMDDDRMVGAKGRKDPRAGCAPRINMWASGGAYSAAIWRGAGGGPARSAASCA